MNGMCFRVVRGHIFILHMEYHPERLYLSLIVFWFEQSVYQHHAGDSPPQVINFAKKGLNSLIGSARIYVMSASGKTSAFCKVVLLCVSSSFKWETSFD